MLTSALTFVALPAIAFGATFEVSVGASGLRYDPPTTNAAPGDIVHFTFFPKAHSVTQSSFESPCSPFAGGFDSGLLPSNADAPSKPEYSLTINDTQPLYIYCKQPNGNHCGNGMVHIINPGQYSFNDFQAAANSSGGVAGASSAAPAASGSGSASASATSSYSTPPPQSWSVVTAPVTHGASSWTTVYTSYAGTPQPTFAAQPVDHKIIVGVDGRLAYGQTTITAAIGDTVTWEFHPKNHTVTQSSFGSPCSPLEGGFKSGFKFIEQGDSNFPTFSITVNDTAPIWYYCGQKVGNHCGNGMVGSINSVESGPNNFQAFQDLAKQANGSGASGAGGAAPSGGSGSDGSGSPNAAQTTFKASGLLALVAFFATLL